MLYGLSTRQIESLKEILDRSFGKSKAKAFIFGSRSRGDSRKNSDIDIVVDSKETSLSRKVSLAEELYERSTIPYKLDLPIFNELNPEYRRNIKREKKLLWSSKTHSKWRICPLGEHWVRRHPRRLKTGRVTSVTGHCRKNSSGKELITSDELELIGKLAVFTGASPRVSGRKLGFGAKGAKFDNLISGWVAYWNDSLSARGERLPPNIVKALIASESGFNSKARAKNRGRVGDAVGLMQITEQTRKILRDQKGELRNHYVIIERADLLDPSKNIAAGVRWLFRKKKTARARLRRNVTWSEAVFEYKGILKQKGVKAAEIKRSFRRYLESLK